VQESSLCEHTIQKEVEVPWQEVHEVKGKMTCLKHNILLQQLKEAQEEIERLKEENESLWFMLDEMKESDKLVVEKVSETLLLHDTPQAEA